MTLMMLIILTAILIVFAFFAMRKAAGKSGTSTRPQNTDTRPIVPPGAPVPSAQQVPKETNPHGSIPDKPGTRGDGDSALSAGGQG